MQSTKRPLLIAIIPALVLAIAAPAWAAVNDPDFPVQWALHKVQSEPSWAISTGRGIVVAVLDSGVDFRHPEFAGKSAGSFTCIGGPCRGTSGYNHEHGTLVAGVIAALTNNGEGVASVAPDAKIMSVAVLNEDGIGNGGDIGRAIRFAADQPGVKVMNMSLGSLLPGTNTAFGVSDFQYAVDKGVVIVVASGNQEGNPISSYAGAGDLLLVVGATGPNDEVSTYTTGSTNDTDIDVYAPGGNRCGGSTDQCIQTTAPGGKYAGVQGTSVAAPHVAGVAAQLRCLGKNVSQTHALIKQTADRVNGVPRVNAAKAVGAPAGAACAANFPVTAGSAPTTKSKTQAPTGVGGRSGQTQAGGQSQSGQAAEPTQGGQPGEATGPEGKTAGEIAAEAEKKKSNRTLINVLIGVALLAAIGSWYGYTKWKASRAPVD